jgi:ABC-type glutathione transport system ATPase component
MTTAVVEVADLRTYFHTDEGVLKAVNNVSFAVEQGRTLGIVGESGSGKSVASLSIMRLLAPTARIETGSIALLGRDLVHLPEARMRAIRGRDMSMIFQEPMTSWRRSSCTKSAASGRHGSGRSSSFEKWASRIPKNGSIPTRTSFQVARSSGS